jgi:hypothetical protein
MRYRSQFAMIECPVSNIVEKIGDHIPSFPPFGWAQDKLPRESRFV